MNKVIMYYHRGPYFQRGRGIGSIFSGLFKSVLPLASNIGRKIFGSPIAKSIANVAKEVAIETGVNLAADALAGKNMKQSVQQNVTKAREKVAEALTQSIEKPNEALPKKKAIKRKGKRPAYKIKSRKSDIFS